MLNPHPPLTGFPFALLTLCIASELYAAIRSHDPARRFARTLLYLLTCIAPLTYFSGYWGAEAASQTFRVSESVIAAHQNWAQGFILCLFATTVLSAVERNAQHGTQVLRSAFLIFLFASYGLVIYTSFLGGNLVFSHGAGVRVETP